MRTLLIGTCLHMLTFIRIKTALFFSFFFPSFIYVIFTMIWGANSEAYHRFLMTGIIVMTTASDAINSIGNVIQEYYRSGMIKFFKVTPYSFYKNVASLIASRAIIVILSAIPVIVLARITGDLSLSVSDICFILSGIVVALIIFTLMGIIITELFPKGTLANIVFYAVCFLSDTFYPLTNLKPDFVTIVAFNPITPALELARGNVRLIPIVLWIGFLTFIQVLVYINSRIKR